MTEKLFSLSSSPAALIFESSQLVTPISRRTNGMTERGAIKEARESFAIEFGSAAAEARRRSMYRCMHRIRFAAGSRGITCHKGSAKYITKLQRATKLEISFGSLKLDVAQIDRECPMACATIPRIYISQFSAWPGGNKESRGYNFFPTP